MNAFMITCCSRCGRAWNTDKDACEHPSCVEIENLKAEVRDLHLDLTAARAERDYWEERVDKLLGDTK